MKTGPKRVKQTTKIEFDWVFKDLGFKTQNKPGALNGAGFGSGDTLIFC